MTRRLTWSATLVIAIVAAGVAVSAHLKVEKAVPEADAVVTTAPATLQVWFSQTPTIAVSVLTLEGPEGKVVVGKAAAGVQDGKPDRSIVAPITGTLVAGKYTVTWKTSGPDGHIQTDTFAFTFKPGT